MINCYNKYASLQPSMLYIHHKRFNKVQNYLNSSKDIQVGFDDKYITF